eukprot:COSAG06_NODE_111_length_23480_cov_56.592703_5_plen_96_part_00
MLQRGRRTAPLCTVLLPLPPPFGHQTVACDEGEQQPCGHREGSRCLRLPVLRLLRQRGSNFSGAPLEFCCLKFYPQFSTTSSLRAENGALFEFSS